MSILKRKKGKKEYNPICLGLKFRTREELDMVYEITEVNTEEIFVSWEGYVSRSGKAGVHFSLDSARQYFKEGSWIKLKDN